jgi:excisionase family DNA binding protein
MENQRMHKVNEFADALNLSPKTIWAWVYSGKLAVVRLGRAVRINRVNWTNFWKRLD